MITALILASVLSTTEPPRTWVQGTVNSKATWLWGWKDSNGWVQFHKSENPQVFTEYAAKPTVKPAPVHLGAGMVMGADGSINSGVNLQATHKTAGFETNDPAFGERLGLDDRCPSDPNEPDGPTEPTEELPWGIFALVGGLVLIAIILRD